MLIRLFAAFVIVPLIELFLLLKLASYTSVPTTILVVVVTGIIGSILARREGVMVWFRFRSALGEGRMPNREIQDGMMIVFAAALLLTPGLLTDAFGFTLLIPAGRELIRRTLLKRLMGKFKFQVTTYGDSTDPFQSEPVHSEPLHSEPLHSGPLHSGPLHRSERGSTYTIDADAVPRKSP